MAANMMNDENDNPGPNNLNIDPTEAAESIGIYKKIDKYNLLQKIGEGGMGEVWLAEQARPIKRRVAVKIIKLGMDSKQVIARFEAERQALALMNHPCIAKVYDAGTTPEGRPYFVMEYVSGLAITDYCDKYKLTTKERLELFKKVCDGVQHAHHKAIIHRDLKPSNILVSIQDGQATPKIIDFGLAKATAQTLTEMTMVTQFGVMMGTPEYMSPEQAELTTEDVDTRTDVYSLGVVLYNILTGMLPFEPGELREAGLDGIRNVIRNRQPKRPSTCFSEQGDKSKETAELRQVSTKVLYSELSGDLDWITMKTLEKDRDRRYGSAQALAEDISNYLAALPISARPPSKLYELQRFAKRHRVAVIASTLIFIALSAGGLMATVGFIRASRAQDLAEVETRKAEKVSQFLSSILQDANPFDKGSREMTVEDVILKAVPRIEGELAGELEIQGSLRHELGDAFYGLGDFKQAEELLRQSITDFEKFYGGPNLESEDARKCLCWVLQKSGKYDETISQAVKGSEIARDLKGKKSIILARFLDLIGDTYRYKGELVKGEKYMMESLNMFKEINGEVPNWINNDLALVYQKSGKLEKAEKIFREIYKKNLDQYGESNQLTHLFMTNLAETLAKEGKYEEAEEWFRRSLDIRTRVLGPNHPYTLQTKAALESVQQKLGLAN